MTMNLILVGIRIATFVLTLISLDNIAIHNPFKIQA